MAIYVSLTGSDATVDGTNPSTPYRTLGVAEAAAVNGDTIEFADGAYATADLATNGVGDYILMDKALTLQAENDGGVTWSLTDAVYGVRYNANFGGLTSTLRGITFIKEGATAPQNTILIENDSTDTLGTLNVINCNFGQDECLYNMAWSAGSQFGMNINVTGCTFNGTSSNRSPIRLLALDTNSAIVIDDCTFAANTPTTPQNLINAEAADAGVSLSVTNCTFTSTTATGTNKAIEAINIDGVLIDKCTITMGTTSTAAAYAIQVKCDDAALSANKPVVSNCTIYQNAIGGHGILLGLDGTSQGETDRCNDGIMFNNKLYGSVAFRTALGHGMMFGYGLDGNSFGNLIDGVGIGLLCKNSTRGGHFCNTIKNFGESGGTGAGVMSKGCDGTKYYGNTLEITADSYGSAFIANPSTDPVANNAAVECESNMFITFAGADAGFLYASTTDVSQAVTFKKNAYINTDEGVASNSTPFGNQGTAVSIASWVSNVEDDLFNSPSALALVAGGSGGGGTSKIISNGIIL